jgi:hypothetical protein
VESKYNWGYIGEGGGDCVLIGTQLFIYLFLGDNNNNTATTPFVDGKRNSYESYGNGRI